RILPNDPTFLPRLERSICDMAANGVTCFFAGGALGFDTLAARTVLRLKMTQPALSLVLMLPYKGQADKWSRRDFLVYEAIKRGADQVIYVSEEYDPMCMFRRNQRLVDASSHCICFLRKERSGTAYTVRYAKRQGIPIVFL
ncbi:MAG: SLOG family protein, partial [Oscillospiraceae bacterium]|nr:SLOG family protein [Oscillospiraceae bacterium]